MKLMNTALLVHGLMRGPMSMMPLANPLRKAGFRCGYFYYSATFESWDRIVNRLVAKLEKDKPRLVIGHSLGGLLLRIAIERSAYRPEHLVMLGTPNHSPRLGRYFSNWKLFRLFTKECGQWIAKPDNFENLPAPSVPVTTIAGTVGHTFLFGQTPNDCIVAVEEVAIGAESQPNMIVRATHSFIQFNEEVQDRVTEIAKQISPPLAA